MLKWSNQGAVDGPNRMAIEKSHGPSDAELIRLLFYHSGDPRSSALSRLVQERSLSSRGGLFGPQGPPCRWCNDVRVQPSPWLHTLVSLSIVSRPGRTGGRTEARWPLGRLVTKGCFWHKADISLGD